MIITKRRPNLAPDDIVRFEQELGFTLPDQYRTFLTQYNGAGVEPSYFNVRGWKYQQSLVNEFASLVFDDTDFEIRQIYAISGYRYPEGFIPIGGDPGGNTLLLACKNPHRGQVFFWDHEHQPEKRLSRPEDYKNLYFLADSFELFLKNLKSESEL